jgi:hypothetical protein
MSTTAEQSGILLHLAVEAIHGPVFFGKIAAELKEPTAGFAPA